MIALVAAVNRSPALDQRNARGYGTSITAGSALRDDRYFDMLPLPWTELS